MKLDITHAFEKIYGEEADIIFRFCLVRVSNREQALDITQETFLRLWQTLLQEKEILNTKAFLFTVAHRLIIDWYRKKKSVSLDNLMQNQTNTQFDIINTMNIDSAELKAEGRYLVEKIQELRSTFQQPVYLRFVEGLSPPEIGEILGISANAASVRVNRGLLELRKKTGNDNTEDNKN